MSELAVFALLVTGYFAAVNTVYLVQLVIGWRAVGRRLRSIALEDFRDIRESGLAPPVSIVVPAYNEGVTIIESVRSLLALRYPRLELVVVNDGSSDDTLDRLIAEFGLRRTPRVYWQRIKSKPVRGIYWSPAYPGLWVLDKVNGRKADAVNAGINLASAPYVCVVDGDSVLERDAMAAIMHAVLPQAAETVAAFGWREGAPALTFGRKRTTASPSAFVPASGADASRTFRRCTRAPARSNVATSIERFATPPETAA